MTSRYLKRFGESSLSCGATNSSEQYRLLYLGSSRARLIHVERTKGGATLTYKQLDSLDGPLSAKPIERTLDEAQWKSVVDAIQTAGFWMNPGDVASLQMDTLILLEGRLDGRYRVLTRVGAGPNKNNIPAVAQTFFRLADSPM